MDSHGHAENAAGTPATKHEHVKRQGTSNSMLSHAGSHSRRHHHHGGHHPLTNGDSLRSMTSQGAAHYRLERLRKKMLEVPPWPDPLLYNPRSLFLMTLRNPLRRLCIWGIQSKWWDRTVLFLIFLNTLQLGFLYDPFDTPEYNPATQARDNFMLMGQVARAPHPRHITPPSLLRLFSNAQLPRPLNCRCPSPDLLASIRC